MRNLFISAGHNESAPGAVVRGYREFDFNLKFANARRNGLLVPPKTLREKIDWVNERATPEDIAIELHCNTSHFPSKKGVEVYYADEEDKKLAIDLDRALSNRLGTKLGGAIKLRNAYEIGCTEMLGVALPDTQSGPGSLGWCRQIICPAVIVEVGYMTNYNDLQMLLDPETPTRIAQAIDAVYQGRNIRTPIQMLQDLLDQAREQLVALLNKLLEIK